MAQIDFSSAYRDSTKGATLKALALRRQEAAEAQTAAMAPRQIAAPSQGWAQIAETVGGGIREGRAAAEEQAGRSRLAELLAGGLSPEEMGEATILDPDLAMKHQEHTWDIEQRTAETAAREKELLRSHGWDVEKQTAQVQAQKDAAKLEADAKVAADNFARTGTIEDRDIKIQADKDAADARARVEQTQAETETGAERETQRLEFEREQGAPQTEEAKLAADLKAGRITQEAFDAAMAKQTHIAPSKPGDVMTPGAQEIDKKAGPEVLEWKQVGGANAVKAIKDTRTAIDILQTRGGTGFMAGVAEAALPEALNKLVNPDGTIAQDSIRNTVQMTLRPILGAQFTQQEGEALMKRAFDINMSGPENVRRAKLILEQVEQITDAKQDMADYWDAHGGSLYGWTPKSIDFNALKTMFADEQTTGATGGTAAAPGAEPSKPDDIPQVEWDNMTPEDKALFR